MCMSKRMSGIWVGLVNFEEKIGVDGLFDVRVSYEL